MNLKVFTTVAILAFSLSSTAQEYFPKQVKFPEVATAEEKLEMASRVIPDERQKAWQDLELTAFLHFGINTYTGKEWGEGDEDPMLFNPAKLDAEQWVKTLKDAGFKLVMLTAKHHDGFCLWPTKTTSHSVVKSPWREGKGDVVKELRDACDKHGMKLGLYLSPWDRNAACYGSDAYNDFYLAQLTELLTHYGKIDEIWFDGANGEGPNGKKQVYDWTRIRELINKLQPGAVTAIMGDDVRWVGNERGLGRETEWSVTPLNPLNPASGLSEISPDLGGRDIVSEAKSVYWYPSEVDVSIRPGWFYHENERPKTVTELANIYLQSVGRNSGLLLNVPPDTDGLITQEDSVMLSRFGQWVKASFSNPSQSGTISVVDYFDLGEDISKGQKIEQFDIEVLDSGNNWKKVASGTTIGRRRIVVVEPVEIKDARVVVNSSRGDYHLNPVRYGKLAPLP